MIPKIIHWCWLSGEPVPADLQKYINSWRRVMPDYEIKCWTTENFDVNRVPWVAQAVEHRKWAYAADYIRLYALYHEGGIYLDSDVMVLKPFDAFLGYDYFTAIEVHRDFYTVGCRELDADKRPVDPAKPVTGLGLQAAIMGGSKGCAFLKSCMDWYETHRFVGEDGSLNLVPMPGIIALEAVRYGFRYEDRPQLLESDGMRMQLFDSSVFAGSEWDADKRVNYAIHYCNGSWRDYSVGRHLLRLSKRAAPSFIRKLFRRNSRS